MRFALILSLLIAIAAVVFALYNPDPVRVNLIQYEVTSPLAVVVIVMLLAGVLVGVLASVPGMIRRGTHTRRLERRVAELEGSEPQVVERVVERPVAAPAAAAAGTTAEGAAETQRLAAETQRMAAEAQRRAAEAERLEAERRGGPPPV